ncbi:MAG: hypothetical protein U9M95_02650 [Candidatus Altiarchaeota archaeon]|nr:hypothetical protein [Candidatus Altiarchaeota archaeon]
MNQPNNLEQIHKTNIERLIEEFGEEHVEEIEKLYTARRSFEESDAKIRNFIPIFAYRTVREKIRCQNK